MERSMRHLCWLVACVALAVLTPLAPGSRADTSPPGMKVGAVSQPAYAGAVAQADGGLQRPIKFGNPVYAQETVRTGPDGSTELQFLDEARLQVGANASVKLDQYSYDPASGTGGGLIDMFVGAYDFVSGRMNSDDKVRLVTPTVTIGLRGTALSLYIAGDGRTDVTVKAGLVSLAPCRDGALVTLGAGQRASVGNDCVVTNPDADPAVQPQPFRRQDFIIHKPPRPSPKPKTRSNSG